MRWLWRLWYWLTHERCDTCRELVDRVWMTEQFTESGWMECACCIGRKPDKTREQAEIAERHCRSGMESDKIG